MIIIFECFDVYVFVELDYIPNLHYAKLDYIPNLHYIVLDYIPNLHYAIILHL